MVNFDVLRGANDRGDSMDSSCPISALSYLSTKPPYPPVVVTATATLSSGETDSSLSCRSHAGDGKVERRVVRFANECGSKLVTKAVHSTYWWDDMLLGVDRCPNCGHVASPAIADSIDAADAFSRNGGHQESEVSVMESVHCESCGAPFRTQPPGELFQFIEKLSNGVEATVVEPSLMDEKLRRVLLYTNGNGETISWFETGRSRASKPHNIPCDTLLEVKDCTAESAMRRTRGYQGHPPATSKNATSFLVTPTTQRPQQEVEEAKVKPRKSNSKKPEVPNTTSSMAEEADEAKSMEEMPSEGGLFYREYS